MLSFASEAREGPGSASALVHYATRRRGGVAVYGACPTTKEVVIGFLGALSASASSSWVAAFLQRLHELGWTEDRNVALEYRWAEGRNERLAEFAAEFVRLKVDIIATH